jgi:hypothetical protein
MQTRMSWDDEAASGPEPLFLVGRIAEEELEGIVAEPTKELARARLAAAMDIDQDDGLPTEILADMHFYNFLFCQGANFSTAKTSCFLSIMKQVFRNMIAERLTSDEAFDLTKKLLLTHSVARPPYSVAVFSANDLKVIMDYVLNTFFRHFNLYQYVYVPHRQLKLRGKTSTFLPPIPFAMSMADIHGADPKAQEELAVHFEKPARAEDLTKELFDELAAREARIEGEAQRVIAMALERRCEKKLAEFDAIIKQQDQKFEAEVRATE